MTSADGALEQAAAPVQKLPAAPDEQPEEAALDGPKPGTACAFPAAAIERCSSTSARSGG